jgi:hypothetical protein
MVPSFFWDDVAVRINPKRLLSEFRFARIKSQIVFDRVVIKSFGHTNEYSAGDG